MGFISKIKKFFSEEISDQSLNIETNQVSHPTEIENQLFCNACGKPITTKPKMVNHDGKQMFFCRRCYRNLRRGVIPK